MEVTGSSPTCENGGGRTGGSCSSGGGGGTAGSGDTGGSSGGFGGTGTGTPDIFPDECNTASSLVDELEAEFSELWEDSAPDAQDLSLRIEQGGLLMPNDVGGYDLLRVGNELGGSRSACSISITDYGSYPLTGWLPGVIFIHTHPLGPGLPAQEACPGEYIGSHTTTNGPSAEDRSVLRVLSTASGDEVIGIVIDGDEIFVYQGESDGSGDLEPIARCGY